MAALEGDTASTTVLATLCDCKALLVSGELTALADAAKELPQRAPGVRCWSRDDLAGLAAAVTACSAHLKQLCVGPGDAAAASSSPEEEALPSYKSCCKLRKTLSSR